MESLSKKYIFFIPIYVVFASLLSNMWMLAFIGSVFLVFIVSRLDLYRQVQMAIGTFYRDLLLLWVVTLVVALNKNFGFVDGRITDGLFFLLIMYMIFFFFKIGRVLETSGN